MEDDEGGECRNTSARCWNTPSYRRYHRLGVTRASSFRRRIRVELSANPRATTRQWSWGRNTQPADPRSRRRGWRIKVSPRLQFFRRLIPSPSLSPRRLITRLRDAYVSLMLRVASGGGALSSAGYGFSAEAYQRPLPQAVLKAKEYDVKALAEVYRKMVAEGRVLGTVGASVGSGRWARA